MMDKRIALFFIFLAFAALLAACSTANASLPIMGEKQELKDLGAEQCRECHGTYFEEWDKGSHKLSLATLKKQPSKQNSCLGCMSADGVLASKNKTVNLDNAKQGITCLVCHLPHGAREGLNLRLPKEILCISCHTAGKIVPGKGVHHPQKEMFLGTGGIGVKDMPSKKSQIGVVCFDCHMPFMGKDSIAIVPDKMFNELQPSYQGLMQKAGGQYVSKNNKDRSSHSFKVILEGPDTSCIKCHPQMPVEAFRAIVDEVFADIKVQVDQLEPRMVTLEKALKALQDNKIDPGKSLILFNEAKVNFDLVKYDGSYGFHNYPYASALITAAREKFEQSLAQLP